MPTSKKRPRARDLGLIIGELSPGNNNHLSDVSDVRVGHSTIIKGDGKLIPGKGPVRTGVTVILPHANNIFHEKVPAAAYVANGFGKATGIPQIEDLGVIETPIAITNTLNVGLVWDAVMDWMLQENPEIGVSTGSVSPVIAECFDGYLNDIRGRHVKAERVFQAISGAREQTNLTEGVVGAGTGMCVFQLKSGVGSASRVIPKQKGGFTVGVLTVPNFGRLKDLTILGVPIGKQLSKKKTLTQESHSPEGGSIVTVIATDAPLTSRQLFRVAKRAMVGIARTGSIIGHSSGDFVFTFSTNPTINHDPKELSVKERLAGEGFLLNDLFRATIEATEEAIINALFQARTIIGRDNNTAYALPVEETVAILKERDLIAD
ncbi:MAG: S58 family peptidase [Candidatus Heimdallarchaeota archaeon]|nr:S58 family peptidase [Candidatus Heimdallarchaeota archaeon]